MSRLTDLLKIRPGEGRMVLLLVGLMLAASAGMGLGASGIDALFFARYGVQYLPTMYLILGGLTLVTMLFTSALLGRVEQRQLYTTLPLILALVLVAERAAMALDFPWLYPVIWLAKGIIGTFQGLFSWGLAGAACDTRQAKRLFPLFSAGGILGTVIGASLTPLIVPFLHSENLILVWAATLAAAFGVSLLLAGRAPARPSARARRKQPGLVAQMRQGFDFVRKSQLLSLISLCAMLFSVAWFSLEFPFNSAATAAFPNEDALAGFLGIFMGANTAVALLVSLFLANRLFARFGIMPMILVFPAIYLGGFVILSIASPFPLIAAVRFAQIGWAQGVAGTAWQAMYNVIPRQRRDQARAFIDGVPSQAGVVMAGLLLIFSQQFLQPEQVYLIGLVTAAIIVFVMWRALRAYKAALVEAVRAGQPQVFFAVDEKFDGLAGDAQAIQVLVDGLSDPDPVTRRVSLGVISGLSVPDAANVLAGLLADPDPEVRAKAALALSRIEKDEVLLKAAALLDDPNPDVRGEAVYAASQLKTRPPDITARLRVLLGDPAPAVRAEAALALLLVNASRADEPQAEATLIQMVSSPDSETKVHALEALVLLARPEQFELIASCLADPDSRVRRAAAQALMVVQHPRKIDTLVLALADDDLLTRQTVARVLGDFGEPAVEPLAAALHIPALKEGALLALGEMPLDAAAAGKVRAYALESAAEAQRYHDLLHSVPAPGGDDRAGLLRVSLQGKARGRAIDALQALSLVSAEREELALAAENLQSPSPDQQTNALEVLESLGGQAEVIRPLVRLWEPDDPPPATSPGYALHILQDEDGWLRACAALAASAAGDPELRPALEALATSDRDPLVRETAAARLAGDQAPGRLSTMARIQFLRKVSLFGSLPPYDLRPIAQIAEEERHAAGQTVFAQGSPGDKMFILTAGQVRVMVSRDGGPPAEVARRGPGDVVGEMSVISQEPRIASVIAEGEVHVLAIARGPFEKLLRDNPEIALAVMRVLCTRIREKGG